LFLAEACPGQEQEHEGYSHAKGIFRATTGSAAATQAAQFYVLLPNNEPASPEHEFHSKDHLKFQFVLKKGAYVCVLNRTIKSAPSIQPEAASGAGSKGITRIKKASPSHSGESARWRLLIPERLDQPVKKDKGETTDTGDFVMDNDPGFEIVAVIVSPQPVELTPFLDKTGSSQDDGQTVLHSLEGSLADWSTNCVAELAPSQGYTDPEARAKGIFRVEKESYAYARDSGRPCAFQVKLKHLP
jgi:hypothetical protein